MKKYILFFLLLSAHLFAYAEKVEVEAAKGIAVNFLKTDKSNGANHARAKARADADADRLRLAYTKFDDSGTPLFYVFNNGFSSGFVIVSADDCITSVLGYSDSGYFDIDSISNITKEWLDGYGVQIRHGITAKVQMKASDNQSSSHIPVAPLTRSEWGQGSPYNNDCPNQYPAGCVPVAVGQVMYYYRWPDVTADNYSIEWDRILADYKGASSSSSRAAVAGLIRHIGIKSGTVYAEDGSSTFHNKAIEAMVQNYKYNSKCTTKYKSDYTDTEWDNLIYNELKEKRLVLYSANNSSVGHEFIIDGYEYGYFHVNWGWNGQSNGYFLLSALMDYNQDGCVVVDLLPAGDYSTEENIVKWGYCNDDLVTLIGAEERKGGGVIIPKSELKSYIGQKVIGMEVGLVGDVQDMECFISLGVDNNIISSQWFETGYGGWNRILFDYPYVIEGEEIFAGYTFWEKLDDVAIATSTRTDTQKMYGSNSGYTFDGSRWSAGANSHVAVRLLLEGSQLPLDVRLTEVDDVTIEKGESLYLTGTIENMSNSKVDQCTFMYSVGGNSTKEATINVALSANQVGHFSIPTDWEYQDGYHDINVWITKVNGKEDAVKSNNEYWKTNSAQLKGRGLKFKRRMVVEESTATWCGWCPRGIVALERMKEEYPDDFIGIAIHGGDNMSGADNYRISDSYPSGLINRVVKTNMNYADLKGQLSLNSGYADVDIDANANFTVKESGSLEINTSLTWGTINPNHKYQLAYVVIEDNVGPYLQDNYYTDGSLASLGWNYTTNVVSTFYYDVARGIYDTYNGVPESILGDIIPNVKYNYSHFLTLPSSVANKDNVSIVCMVINVNTGEIMNAVKTSISNYSGNDNLVLSHNRIVIDNIQPQQLYASIVREEYKNMPLMWGSMDDAIATVDQSGLVKGISAGTTTIFVQIKDLPLTRRECIVSVLTDSNVHVKNAGTLGELLGNKKYEFNKLKITGEINGSDLDVLGQMIGYQNSNGNLTYLDLTEARIVKGGTYTYNNTSYSLEEDDILPEHIFCNSQSLKFISTPSTLKNIGSYAFVNSSSIEEIVLNEGLETIGAHAFAYQYLGCGSLKKINIPSTLKNIGSGAIAGCYNITVNFDIRNPYLCCDGKAIYSLGYKKLLMMIPSSQGTYTVHEDCVSIRALNSYLLKGVIASSVRNVEDYAFQYEDSLSILAFGSPLSTIGSEALCHCENLKNVYLGCKNVPGGKYRNSEWNSISKCTLYVPSSSIDAYKSDSFWSKMKAIKPIENTEYAYLANLGDGSVRKDITMSHAGTLSEQLGDEMFHITHLKIDGEINGDDLDVLSQMMGCNTDNGNLIHLDLTEARIVKGGGYQHGGKYYILNEDDCLPYGIFGGNKTLKYISMPSSLTKIENNAFTFSDVIDEIVLNEGLETIEYDAFYFCTTLKKLNIPSTLKTVGSSMIGCCYNVQIEFDNRNPYLCCDGKAIYSKNYKSLLMMIPSYRDIYIVHENCTNIRSIDAYTLEGLIAPNVRTVQHYAFQREIRFIALGSPLATLGIGSLHHCENLESLYLGCATIPEGEYLNSEWNSISKCTLYVPSSSIDAYKSDSFWSKMKAIKPIENTEYAYLANLGDGSVRKDITMSHAGTLSELLGDEMFDINHLKISGEINGDDLDVLSQMMGCNEDHGNLTHLDLTDARIVKGGGYYYVNYYYYTLNEDDCLPAFVFGYSNSLRYISMPSTLKKIGRYVLCSAKSTEEIVLNEGLETIEDNAFFNNSSLKNINLPSTLKTIGRDFLSSCKNVTVTFDDRNPYLRCDEKAIYSTDYNTLLMMIPSSQGTYTVHENCVSIREVKNGLLTGLIAPNVREVSNNAFYYENSLSLLAFSSLLGVIGSNGLYHCEKLEHIYLGCKTAPDGAYRDSKWDNISNCTLYVPSSSIDTYMADSFWSKMKAIKPIENTEYAYLANLGDGSVRKDITMLHAGSLSEQLGDEKFDITHLKISGEINGDDLDALSQMMGCNKDHGNLTHLDLSDARIVKGGSYTVLSISYTYSLDEDDCLPYFVFGNNRSLKYISMPSSLKKIEEFVFTSSNSIEEIVLNEGLEEIEYGAFRYSSSLKRINIPSTLKAISTDVFDGCYNVTVNLDKRNPYLCCDGKAIYTTNYKTLLMMIPSSQGTYTVHENCYQIRQIQHGRLSGFIAPSVRVVSSGFSYVSSLSILAFGSSLTSIGSYGLHHCDNLKNIYLGCKFVPEGGYRNSEWNNISECTLYVPSSSIDVYKADSFWGRMKAIKAIENTEYAYLANNDDGSVCVTMSKAGSLLEILGEDLFDIAHLTIEGPINGDDLDVLNKMMGCHSTIGNLTHLDLSAAHIVKGGKYQYYNSIYTLDEDDILPMNVFDGARLSWLSTPNSLKRIENRALNNSSLYEIYLNEGLEEIGQYAFSYTSSNSAPLNKIHVPSTVYNLDKSFIYRCDKLTDFSISENNPYYEFDNNAIYTKGCKKILCIYPPFNGIIELKDKCDTIGEEALGDYLGIHQIKGVIGNNVKMIQSNAFMNSYEMEFVALGSKLSYIDSAPFNGCRSLKEIYIGSVEIPSGCYKTTTDWPYIVDCTLYVPSSSIDSYKADTFWGRMKAIKPIEGTEFEYLKNPESESIEVIECDNQPKIEIYTIDGRKVSNVSRGLYIVNGLKVVK